MSGYRNFYRLATLPAIATLAFLSVVGSGGGGGGGASPTTPVVYTGVTSIATVTPTNASKLTSDVVGGGDAASIIGGGVSGVSIGNSGAAQDTQEKGSGALDLSLRLSRIFRDVASHAKRASATAPPVASVVPVDDTVPCDNNQGSIRIFGTLNDDGTGTVSVTFSFCLLDGVTVNGPATMQVHVFDLGLFFPTDFTISFVRLTLRASGLSVDTGGSIRVQINVGTNTETVTVNMVELDNFTGETVKIENFAIVSVYDNILFPTTFTGSLTGRVFDYVYGYVDVTTATPFVFATLTQLFPNGGEILLTGSGGGTILVRALSATMVELELDLDGMGGPDNTARLKWTDLTGPVGSDLGDDDGDGMHNSWEVAYGLNPNDPSDAALDHDGDGASSLSEYMTGTDPNDDTSTPSAVDLSISVTDSPDPVFVGGNLTYAITVSNTSAMSAFNVVMTDTLPTSVDFVSATPGQGTCTGTSTVICSLGTLNAFSDAVVSIVVLPNVEGVSNNTATVTSDSFEINTANNSATSTTAVGQSAAGIQGLIDAASNGDTIIVAPGVYIGNINFGGKAITVKSDQGPTVTIIDGAGLDSVVTFNSGEGNTSVLDGFTIQNGSASEGGGISVQSSSPTIINNIIADNTACAGAGIGLGFASPVIQGNIIRNNSKGGCSGGIGGGGVSIRGASSPQILDNDISGNSSSDGGGLSLFAAGTPTIRNNVISGNSGGAIDMVNASDALIVQNVISGNSSPTCGGISWLVPSGARGPRLVNNTIVDNDGAQGSGICADGFDV